MRCLGGGTGAGVAGQRVGGRRGEWPRKRRATISHLPSLPHSNNNAWLRRRLLESESTRKEGLCGWEGGEGGRQLRGGWATRANVGAARALRSPRVACRVACSAGATSTPPTLTCTSLGRGLTGRRAKKKAGDRARVGRERADVPPQAREGKALASRDCAPPACHFPPASQPLLFLTALPCLLHPQPSASTRPKPSPPAPPAAPPPPAPPAPRARRACARLRAPCPPPLRAASASRCGELTCVACVCVAWPGEMGIH